MSNKQTPEEQLDYVLKYLYNDEEFQETQEQISQRIKTKISNKDLHLILEKLVHDGYVYFSFVKNGGKPTDERTFYISFSGRLFLRRGGFQKESKILKRKNRWTIAKTIAATLNAISILAIAIWGVVVSKESKLKDKQIVKLETIIDSSKSSIIVKSNDSAYLKRDTIKLK